MQTINALASTTLLASGILYYLLSKGARRASLVPPKNERVLILGATSGIGQSIALQYAERGASVCVVGRRQGLVDDITAQCSTIAKKTCLGVCADFTDVEGLLRIRDVIQKGPSFVPHSAPPNLQHALDRMGRPGHSNHRSRRIGAPAHHGRRTGAQRHGPKPRPHKHRRTQGRAAADQKHRQRRPQRQLPRPAHVGRHIRA